MPRFQNSFRLEVANRLHSAAIHLLRHARRQDVLARQAPARLSALSVLVFGPTAGGPMTLKQLAAAEQVKAPTMSRIVAGLKRAGLAKIEADVKDARRIQVTATARGRLLLQQARTRRVRLVAEILSSQGEPEMNTLLKAADLMERAVQQAVTKREQPLVNEKTVNKKPDIRGSNNRSFPRAES